ncbi:MAG: ABC transporter substrate-binding protein [Lachnospiraceae bacterium]|nr:ABC transporter substrate-binding protein [Lachnospiraceae bacterium]
MRAGRRLAAVCIMCLILTAALGACTGGRNGGDTSQQASSAQGASSTADSGESASDAGQTDAAQTRDDITIGIPQDIDSLDPHAARAAGSREVLFNLYEGLVKPSSDGELLPAIASAWTISDDATVYTFTLREGVLFHDGSAVTAEDVVYSIERCADPEQPDTFQSALEAIESVSVTENGEVEIVLGAPDSEFLAQLTCAIIPAGNATPAQTPVGTGPYKYVSHAPQQNLVIEKFDDYWDPDHAAHIRNVTFKIEADVNTVVMELKAGTIDMFCRLTTDMYTQLADDFTIYEGTMNLVVAMYLNNAHAPFNDARVRQALCYALDKEEIFDFIFDGSGTPLGSSMYPSFGKYFDASLNDTYTTDIDRAKELLAEAGYENGFTFTLTIPSNYDQYVDMSEVIREQMARIGVTVNIQLIEWNSWLSDVYGGREYEATIVGVDASTMTAAAMLSRFRSDASNNFVNFNSAAYDTAFANAKAAVDDDEKTAYYKECLTILSEEAANVYIMDMPNYVALNPAFTGYVYYPLYLMDVAALRPVN